MAGQLRTLVIKNKNIQELKDGERLTNNNLIPYMLVQKVLQILEGSRMLIEAGAGIRIAAESPNFTSSGFRVQGYMRVNTGSSLTLETSSSGTVLGV